MTGIIKACYPGADREKAKTFSEKLLQLVESFEKKTPKELQEAFAKVQKKMKDGDIKEARKCAATGNSGLEICEKPTKECSQASEDWNKFLQGLPAAMGKVMDLPKFKELATFVKESTYDCQSACAF